LIFCKKINNAIPQERALFDTAIKQFITGQSGTEYLALGFATVKPLYVQNCANSKIAAILTK
jgi:hypothetical protein